MMSSSPRTVHLRNLHTTVFPFERETNPFGSHSDCEAQTSSMTISSHLATCPSQSSDLSRSLDVGTHDGP